ncbi:MAG: hypothetical protein AB7H97_19550 [Pseudobdellovibrionaceae bacterium]
MRNVVALIASVLFSLNAFAAKTDQEVAELAAKVIKDAVIGSTILDSNRACRSSFFLNRDSFVEQLDADRAEGMYTMYAQSDSPEGNGCARNHYRGAIIVTAGEAYHSTQEEFERVQADGGPSHQVLGFNLLINRSDCEKGGLTGTLEVFSNKDNNVVSKSEFKIK